MTSNPPIRLGYKASAEQFGPSELLSFALQAERLGFDDVASSDHFQPWRHEGGHSPAVLPWLGALGGRSERIRMGTSVLTPTFRYHPAVVAQAFATLGSLFPDRVFLGVGTGESMNETPITAGEWPPIKERRLRLAEAIELMRRLWREDRVDFEGEYYTTRKATIYDRPETPVPVYVAASGPLAAKLAGRVGDGFICTSGKDPELYRTLLDAVAEGAQAAGRDAGQIAHMIEIKVSYERDEVRAERDCRWWAALALSGDEKAGVEDPMEMERLADANADRASTRFIVSNNPADVAERIGTYIDLGFHELVFHFPGDDQAHYLDLFARDVLPLLRRRAPAATAT